MKASGSWRRMERRAPASRVWRARERSCGDVEGVGRRAFSFRSCFFAVVRRGVIFGGDGWGVDWSCERVDWRSEVDMMRETLKLREGVKGCFVCC